MVEAEQWGELIELRASQGAEARALAQKLNLAARRAGSSSSR